MEESDPAFIEKCPALWLSNGDISYFTRSINLFEGFQYLFTGHAYATQGRIIADEFGTLFNDYETVNVGRMLMEAIYRIIDYFSH